MPKFIIILNLIAAILWGFNCGVSIGRHYRTSTIIEAGIWTFFTGITIIGIITM